ncbi:response regulator [Litorivivens sp.]|uniref:response regulator n=1 Tax=Litorivivens sp. TaxID=2020868 RepID=UPI0035683FD6
MASKRSLTNAPSRRPVQILLAEDCLGDVILVRRGLEKLNIPFELSVVDDGEQLLNYLVDALRLEGCKQTVPTPDLVLIDLNMPKLDGFKALELIAQKENYKELPLVVVSSSANPEDIRLAYELGAHGYIDKALGPAAFIERLQFLEHYWRREGLLIAAGSKSRH